MGSTMGIDGLISGLSTTDLINQGIGALIISPIKPDAMGPIVDAAKAKGIPVVVDDIGGGGTNQPPGNTFTSVTRSGSNLVLTWSAGTLEQADEVTGPWNDIPDAKSPESLTSSSIRSFYRISVP